MSSILPIDEICPKCNGNYTTSYYDNTKGKITLWRHECGACGYNSGEYKTQNKAAEVWESARPKQMIQLSLFDMR